MNVQEGLLFALMFFGPDCWYQHGAKLEAEMFDGADYREIFTAIAKLNQQGKQATSILVAESVSPEAAKVAIHIGSTVFMSKGAVKSYVEHLRKSYAIRKAQDIGAQLAETGDMETAKADLMSLSAGQLLQTIPAMEANRALVETLSKEVEQDVIGLTTGLTDLDSMLMCIEPSDLCILAARPRMGKTAAMLNIALNTDWPVGIFSLEMSTPQLMKRMVAAKGVDYGRLRRPRMLTDDDWPKITHATKTIGESGIWINDTGALSIGDLEAEAYRMVKGLGVRALFIDYLQLITCKAENRLEAVSEVSRRLKALAKNLDIPVVALCQLNRSAEKRGQGTYQLSDLRESGQIEQDADQIIFINRPEVVAEEVRPGEADFIVAKNRGGETGTAKAAWQGHYQRFVDMGHNPMEWKAG